MKKALIITLALALSLFAFAGCGNTDSENTYKVGIVQFVDDASLNQIRENIEAELDAKSAELGVKFEYKKYTYNGQADAATLNQIAATLMSANVDIIIPIATPAAQIMLAATEDNDTPIVFSAVSDPVGAGLVDSLTPTNKKITGTSDFLDTQAVLNLMFAANPDIKSVGLLYSKSEDSSEKPIAEAKQILASKGVKVVEKTGVSIDEISTAADALVLEGVDAVFTPTDNTVMTAELAIYEKFAKAKIPHYCGADSFALNGAFCGYGVNYAQLGVVTADMAVDVLLGKSDFAVKTLDSGIVTINTETCAAIGFDLETIKSAFSPLAADVKETTTKKAFD